MRLSIVLIMSAVICVTIVTSSQDAVSGDYGAELMNSDIASLNGIDCATFWTPWLFMDHLPVSHSTLAELRHDLYGSLSRSGIKILSSPSDTVTLPAGCSKTLELLYHYLDDGQGGYVLNCHLTFNQPVLLESGRSNSATTWSESYLAYGPNSSLPELVRKAAEYCIGEFVRCYLFANQKDFLHKSDSVWTDMEEKYGP